MSLLNIDFRFALQSYTPFRLTIVPFKSRPMARAISVTKGSASRNNGDSFRLPGALTNKRSNYIATSVAEGNNLVTLHVFLPTITNVISTFFSGCCRPITMDYAGILQIILVKFKDRPNKNSIHAAVRFPSSKNTVNACVVDLGTS